MPKNWDGRYENTKEAKDGLEGEILRQMEGKRTSETSTGGTMRTSSSKVDIYTPNPSAPKGHDHEGYNIKTGETYGH